MQKMHEDYTHGGCVRRNPRDDSGRPCLTSGGFDLAADPVAVVCQVKDVSERRKTPVMDWSDKKSLNGQVPFTTEGK